MLSSSFSSRVGNKNNNNNVKTSFFSSFRYYVGNTILITMGVSIVSLYTVTQLFRLYKSLRPEAALHRDVCLSGVRMFLNRMQQKEREELRKTQTANQNLNNNNTDKNEVASWNYEDFLFANREEIFDEVETAYATLHQHGATFSTIVVPSWCISLLNSLLPARISKFFLSWAHPWITNSDVAELRKLGEQALGESIKKCDAFHQQEIEKASKNPAHSHYNLSGIHFVHVRALYRCAQIYHLDIPFWSFLRLKQWWMRKKGAFAGYRRAMSLVIEACFSSKNSQSNSSKQNGLNFSMLSSSSSSSLGNENNNNQQQERLSQAEREKIVQDAGDELLELMAKATSSATTRDATGSNNNINVFSFIISLPRKLIISPIASVSDWFWRLQKKSTEQDNSNQTFSLLQLTTWPFLARVSLLILFDASRHLINRHTRQVIGFGSNMYMALSSFYGGVRTSEEADVSSVSVFFITTMIDIAVTRLATSMDYQFSKIIGREATFALSATNLETLEHLKLPLQPELRYAGDRNRNAFRLSASDKSLVFGSQYYYSAPSISSFAKSSNGNTVVNLNAATGDSNYKRHLDFVRDVGRDASVTFSSSTQVSVSAVFLLVDAGWIAYSYYFGNNKIGASHHLKALIVALLWRQFDDTFIESVLRNLFKRPIEQINELADLFSKNQGDDEVFSGSLLRQNEHNNNNQGGAIQNKHEQPGFFASASKMLDTEKWNKFLPLSFGDSGKTLYGCDLLLAAKLDVRKNALNENDSKTLESASAATTATPREQENLLSSDNDDKLGNLESFPALNFCLTSENESCARFAFAARLRSLEIQKSSLKYHQLDFVNRTVCKVIKRIQLKEEQNENKTNNNSRSISSQAGKSKLRSKHKSSSSSSSSPPSLEYVVDPEMPNLVVLDRDEMRILANKHAVQNRIYVVDHSAPSYNISLTEEEFLTLRILGLEVVSSMCGLRLRREKMFESMLNRTAKDIMDPQQNVLFDVLQLVRRYLGQQLGLFLFADHDFLLSALTPSAEFFTWITSKEEWQKLLSNVSKNIQDKNGKDVFSIIKNVGTSSLNLICGFFTRTGLYFPFSSEINMSNKIPENIPHNMFGLPGKTMSWPHTVEYYVKLTDDADERLDSERSFLHFEYFNMYVQELMSFTPLIDTMRSSSDNNYPFFKKTHQTGKIYNTKQDDDDDAADDDGSIFLPLKIEFRDVSFSYRNEGSSSSSPVYSLQNLSFTVNPGETIGIVGESGCGKSSILKLLLRLYDPTSGAILINGVDLKSIPDVRAWRRNALAYMDQMPLLSNRATIRETVEFGRQLPKEVVEEALEMAHCSVFVDKLPDGINTALGNKFSSGERQRLAIARVFAKTAPIILLDEATGALDAVSEGVVVENCFRHVNRKSNQENNNNKSATITTTIVVAHRLSTLKNAVKILVMAKGGKMVGFDTHENLMVNCDIYKELCDRQRLLKGIDEGENEANNNSNNQKDNEITMNAPVKSEMNDDDDDNDDDETGSSTKNKEADVKLLRAAVATLSSEDEETKLLKEKLDQALTKAENEAEEV